MSLRFNGRTSRCKSTMGFYIKQEHDVIRTAGESFRVSFDIRRDIESQAWDGDGDGVFRGFT
ncbi:hypothetical protein BDY19DRAFT_977604, partial [Irpex rosettiformis]